MLNVLAADIIERFYAFMWPMLRISALMLTAPIFTQNAFNLRLRILMALVLTLLVYPLHRWPLIDPVSAQGLLEVFNQIAIGALMGLVLKSWWPRWWWPARAFHRPWACRWPT